MAKARSATAARKHKSSQDVRVAEIRDQAINTGTMAMAALVPEDKALTDMQKLFIKYLVEGDNVAGAMQRAGYNEQPSYGYRMLKMPNILKAKREYEALYAEASKMTKKKVMDMLLEAYDMAKTMSEPSTMVSAAREVGRMCGYYEPTKVKLDISVTGQAMDRLSRLTDEELLKMIESGAGPALLPAGDAQEGSESGDLGMSDLLDMPE